MYISNTYSMVADIGCIAIENKGLRIFFENGFGDGMFDCVVSDKDDKGLYERCFKDKAKFVGSFEVGSNSDAWLLDYDCGGNRVHKFSDGKWFVYNEEGTVYVEYVDNRIPPFGSSEGDINV